MKQNRKPLPAPMRGRLLPLSLLVSALTVGCVFDEDLAIEADCESARCDDLLGRELKVRGVGDPIYLDINASEELSVFPTLEEDGNKISVETADLRLLDPASLVEGDRSYSFYLSGSKGGRFGFDLLYSERADDRWELQRLAPVSFDDSWSIESVKLMTAGDDLVFFVDLIRARDGFLSLTPTFDYANEQFRVPLDDVSELRFWVTPIWNALDWDEGGYKATIETAPSS